MKIPIRRDVFKYKTKIFWRFTARQALFLVILAVTSVGGYVGSGLLLGEAGQAIAGYLVIAISIPCFYFGWYKPKGGFENPEDQLKVAIRPMLFGIAQSILKTRLFEKADIWNRQPFNKIMHENIYLWEPDNLNISERKELLAPSKTKAELKKKPPTEYEYEDGTKHSKY